MRNFSQSLFRSVVPSILLILLTGGVVLDVLIGEQLEEDFDQLITAKSLGLIALVEDGDDGLELENYDVTLPSYALQENAEYFQIFTDQSDVLVESKSLSNWSGSKYSLPLLDLQDTQEFFDVILPDGRAGRLIRKRFIPRLDFDDDSDLGIALELDAQFLHFPADPKDSFTEYFSLDGAQPIAIKRQALTLQLAMSREHLNSLMNKVHSVLVITGLCIIALIVVLAKRKMNKAVEPLKNISSELEEIDLNRIDQRLGTQTTIIELHCLRESINVLLERVESAFNRERHFSSDVAHELRTPLTELKTLLDVTERWPNDPSTQDSFNGDIREISDRMQRIVETLLQLSRSEQHMELLSICPDLRVLLSCICERQQAAAKCKNIRISSEYPPNSIACLGLDQWQSILGNLIENAIEYAPSDSLINIDLMQINNKQFHFRITNKAPELTAPDLDTMFERLWRKDRSRTSTLHSGLGLSLVRACCKQVDAKLSCALKNGRLVIQIEAEIK